MERGRLIEGDSAAGEADGHSGGRGARGDGPRHLPPGLTGTVGDVEEILGRVVTRAEGAALYDVVETVRLDMVAFREATTRESREAALDRAAGRLAALSIEDRTRLARAYTLYLQLVNVCENAYRTHRLAESPRGVGREATRGRARGETGTTRDADAPASARAELTFVITAHPTESRSPENIRLLRRVQDHVVEALARGRSIDRREVENLIHLAWRAGTHPPEKPSVEDEANHLFSLLTDPILTELVSLTEAGHRVLLRTWVGGDKDGHPGVGPEQTTAALRRSRQRLLEFVDRILLEPVREDLDLARSAEGGAAGGTAEAASPAAGWPTSDDGDPLSGLESALSALERVTDGDGGRVEALETAIEAFQSAYRARFGIDHPAIARLAALLEIFPALVVPLELREERGRFAPDDPIAAMMRRLAGISAGGRIDGYARAVVVSMTLEARDLVEAQALADDVFGEGRIPVIPLFELPDVLERAPDILEGAWADDGFRDAVRGRRHLEVMLGYSDTAKRMGMLASRVSIHEAMRRIGEWAESKDVRPLFFHGHGGSVGRGGGRIEDLAATWPPSARTPYKYTLQGEMVERTLATPEILRSLVDKVAEVQSNPPPHHDVGGLARDLAEASKAAFEERVDAPAFRRLLELATPYARLQALTIGSRPARRGGGGLEDLRAIPWVLCWTQTRLLLHAWLGIGEAWRGLSERADIDEALARARERDPLFRSYTRLLSFTMAKTAPELWARYRRRLAAAGRDGAHHGAADGAAADAEAQAAALARDYDAAIDLACRAVGGDTLLPDRPWLEESIRYRAPMIHPLNLLQIDLLGQRDWSDAEVRLFRETVTGIAAGMLTTG